MTNTSNRVLSKNITSLYSIQIANYILPLILLPYLVRTLGVDGYGQLGFALAFTQYFILLTDYGFNWSATGDVAQKQNDKASINSLFWAVTYFRLFLLVLSLIVLLLLCTVVPKFSALKPLMFACFVSVIASAISPTWLFQGIEKMGWMAVVNLSARVLIIPLTFLFVDNPTDVWIAAALQSLTLIWASVSGLAMLYGKGVIYLAPVKFDAILDNARRGWHVFISTAFVNFYTSTNVVILGFFAGDYATGIYASAEKLRQALQGLTTPVSQAIYPRVNALFAKDEGGAFRLVRKTLYLLGGATLAASILVFIFAGYVVELALGAEYQSSVGILRILLLLPVVLVVSNIFGVQLLLSLGHRLEFSRVLFLAGVMNLVLIFPFILALQEKGVAITVVVVESFVAVGMVFVAARKRIVQKLFSD